MTFFISFCPCTRPTDHAAIVAATTPAINSDRFIQFSFSHCSFQLNPQGSRILHPTGSRTLGQPSFFGGQPASPIPFHEKGCPMFRVLCKTWDSMVPSHSGLLACMSVKTALGL